MPCTNNFGHSSLLKGQKKDHHHPQHRHDQHQNQHLVVDHQQHQHCHDQHQHLMVDHDHLPEDSEQPQCGLLRTSSPWCAGNPSCSLPTPFYFTIYKKKDFFVNLEWTFIVRSRLPDTILMFSPEGDVKNYLRFSWIGSVSFWTVIFVCDHIMTTSGSVCLG